MSSALHIIKLAIAWAAGIAAVVCLFVAQPLVVPLGIISLAWSMLPE